MNDKLLELFGERKLEKGAHGRRWLLAVLETLRSIRWILLIIMILGALVFVGGIFAELNGPLPAPDNNAISPLPNIVHSNHAGKSSFFVNLLGRNLLLDAFLLITSALHFGLVALFFFLADFFDLGACIGWFGKYPGTSVVDGFAAYGSHAVLEFIAVALVTSISLWIGLSLIKPHVGKSRWETIKFRYRQAYTVVPIIVVLLVVGAIVETAISLPLSNKYAQRALVSEETKLMSDPQGQWTIEVPETWQRIDAYENPADNAKSFTMLSTTLPGFIEIRASKVDYMNITWEEINDYTIPNLKKSLESRNLKIIEGATPTKLGAYPASKIVAVGKDPTLKNERITTVLYLVLSEDQALQKTNAYKIFLNVNADWYEFSQPIMEKVAQSFKIVESP